MNVEFKNPKILIFPVLFTMVLLAMFISDTKGFAVLWREDGVIESLTALFYACAMLGAIWGAIQLRGSVKAYYLALWIFLAFVFLGEETSWFQRVLNYQTPEDIAAINVQGEFNLHNLKWFEKGGGLLDGTIKNHGLAALYSSQNLYRLGFFTYFLFLPLFCHMKPDSALVRHLKFPYAGRNLLLFIWIPILTSIVMMWPLRGDAIAKANLTETREMYYAFVIFIYVLVIILSSMASRKRSSKQ